MPMKDTFMYLHRSDAPVVFSINTSTHQHAASKQSRPQTTSVMYLLNACTGAHEYAGVCVCTPMMGEFALMNPANPCTLTRTSLWASLDSL